MNIPKNWKGVTVQQFQEILPIYKKTLEETDSIKVIDHWVNIIAILADCFTEQVEELPIPKIKSIISSLSWLNLDKINGNKKITLFLNGKLYKAAKEAKEFNAGRYIEYKTFLGRGGLIKDMHFILATIYQPYFKSEQTHEERAKEFLKAKMSDVYPTVFFYSKVWLNSIKTIQAYGLKLAKEKNKEAEALLMATLREILESDGNGIVQSTR